jgi:hypothetical protein
MQIDFHHTVTYVTARAAGFNHKQAETIAYCAQYVDDAVNSGLVKFSNGAMYTRISSAHKMLDYRNFEELANHQVWMPFHFLPGNGGKKAGQNPQGKFIEKIICKPNSPVAKDMLNSCLRHKNQLYGFHRLGITMHVYADTWAHQGFAGVNHRINGVKKLDDKDKPDKGFFSRLGDFFGDTFDRTKGRFVGGALPLGHGSALSFPDKPWLKWSYKDSRGNKIIRDNTKLFLDAADQMCKAMQRFRAGSGSAPALGLSNHDKQKIKQIFLKATDEDGEHRHKQWLKAIANGEFNFPPVKLDYRSKGKGSWKYQALGTLKTVDDDKDTFSYKESFLKSDWKLFHDALLAHRFSLIHNILPRYGICAA